MITWAAIALQSLALLVLLYVVGSVILFACKACDARSYVFAPVVSVALLGILTLGTHVCAWSAANVLVALICSMALAMLVRLAVERGRFSARAKAQLASIAGQLETLGLRGIIAALLGVLVAFLVALWTFTGISLESPIGIQAYDNPFHFSLVRHIIETGVASPIGAGSITGDANAIYPSLWHALVAFDAMLFGVDGLQGAWAVCVLLIGLIAPIGTVALTKVLFKRPNGFSLFLTAVLPAIAARSLFNCVAWGSLFSNLAALALLPLALAWVVHLQQRGTELAPAHRALAILVACVASIFALGLAHPSTVFVLFIFLVPFAVSQVRRVWAKIVIVAGAFASWLALMCSPLFYRTIHCFDRVEDVARVGQKVSAWIGLDYDVLASMDMLPLCIAALCIAVGLAVALVLRKRFANGWFLVALAFVVAQLLCSLFPENWLSVILTGFWYRDYARLLVIIVFMGSCIFAYVPTFVQMIFERVGGSRERSFVRIVALAVTCLACLLVASHGNDYRGLFRDMSTTQALSAQQVAYMDGVAAIAGDDVVLNNADDDSVWMYPAFGIEALLMGRPASQMSSMSDDLCLLIEGIDRIGEDSAYGEQVRAAARELDLAYVAKMTDDPGVTMKYDDDDKIDYRWSEAITRVSPATAGLSLVYELDGMQLYAVEAVE